MKKLLFILMIPFALQAQTLTLRAEEDGIGRKVPTMNAVFPFLFKKAAVPTQDQPYYFYPENLSWVKLVTPYQQGAALPGSVEYVEIFDIKLDVSTVKVTRILNGQEVIENRTLSEYTVIIHFKSGNQLTLTPARIISNHDNTVPYPGIVPGNRWTFKAAVDDGFIFGQDFSIDGGLKIDYD
jgi:hypothetical protein